MASIILEDIPLWPKPVPAICIYCDNLVAISRHKILYITISLNKSIVDIAPLDSFSQMGLFLLTLYR